MLLRRPPALCTRALRPSYPRLVRYASSAAPLIRIQNGTFYQRYPTPEDSEKGTNPPLFANLTFSLPSQPEATKRKAKTGKTKSQQHWAVIGSTGRTTLLDVLRGQYICEPPTARSYPYLLTDEIAKRDPRLRFVGNAIQYIGFSGEGSGAIGGTRGAYLSARYESHREETDWTLRQYLKGQTELNPLEGEEEGKVKDTQLLEQVISDLRLEELLDMPVANLSNGQTRRARIAKALLNQPELLLLDDPFMGLDPATVRGISSFLYTLAAKASPRLILALRPQDTVPSWITHVMILGNLNQVLLQGEREEINETLKTWRRLSAKRPQKALPKWEQKILDKATDDMEKGFLDRQLLRDLNVVESKPIRMTAPTYHEGEPVIEMDGVRVQYGDKVVLGDWTQEVSDEEKEGLHWTVRRGQRWVVLGANGSGKTTLLSLITSDHPQAYAQPVKLYGRSRLPEPGRPAISLFELQSRMGHSSPEIHAFFPRQLSIRRAIESAFAETFLSKPKLSHERDLDISSVLRYFKPELDPDAAVSTKADPPRLLSESSRQMFPPVARFATAGFTPSNYDVDYADAVTFGQLSTAQQRLVLFLRAVIHKPDLIILDEPFSSMPASVRDKCIHFLERGEHGRSRTSTATRRTTVADTWLKGYKMDTSQIRHNGLSDDQALVMISHVKEEIPDCVRNFVRLPSDTGEGKEDEQLDFRIGALKTESMMSDEKVWEAAWLPANEFEKKASLTKQKGAKKGGDSAYYHWYSI